MHNTHRKSQYTYVHEQDSKVGDHSYCPLVKMATDQATLINAL